MSSIKNNTKRGTSGTKGKQKTTDLATLVQRFYYLDDVLVALSSKWDTQKVGKKLKQRQVLSDYLSDLHKKFATENHQTKFFFSAFAWLQSS